MVVDFLLDLFACCTMIGWLFENVDDSQNDLQAKLTDVSVAAPLFRLKNLEMKRKRCRTYQIEYEVMENNCENFNFSQHNCCSDFFHFNSY